MFFDDRPLAQRKRAKLGAAEGPRPALSKLVPPPRAYKHMSQEDFYNGGDRTFIYDVESYPNFFCVSFKCTRTGEIVYFESSEWDWLDFNALGFLLMRYRVVGFNSMTYDMAMVMLAAQGVGYATLFDISCRIIQENLRRGEIEREYHLFAGRYNHIDVIEVAPLPNTSLKTYSGRLHAPRMQDLPFPFDHWLTWDEAQIVKGYNVNDLDNTELLFNHLAPQIELREGLSAKHKTDLRSKSDAQLAQEIINRELERVTGKKPKRPDLNDWVGRTFYYRAPAYVGFYDPSLQAMLGEVQAAEIEVGHSGHVICPRSIEGRKVSIGGRVYTIGIGGLHSNEKSQAVIATAGKLILDRDVTGYYPNLILKNGYFPRHIGPEFLVAFQNMVDTRTVAKKTGDAVTADTYKIANNGTFGKTSDPFSTIYDPSMMVHTTLTGQLSLLMLIEWLTRAGFEVVSANTDGIVTVVEEHRYEDFVRVVQAWEAATKLETEETKYLALYSRDVNNYIALKEDRKCKVKGVYSEKGSALNSVLSKNPETLICSDAIQALISNGVPIEETITNCKDIRRFVSVRNVNGGAQKDGVYLGKVVRWYYAEGETGAIYRVTKGDKVPKSDGAKPCMDLPDLFPNDIAYGWYIETTNEMLADIGYRPRPQRGTLF